MLLHRGNIVLHHQKSKVHNVLLPNNKSEYPHPISVPKTSILSMCLSFSGPPRLSCRLALPRDEESNGSS